MIYIHAPQDYPREIDLEARGERTEALKRAIGKTGGIRGHVSGIPEKMQRGNPEKQAVRLHNVLGSIKYTRPGDP